MVYVAFVMAHRTPTGQPPTPRPKTPEALERQSRKGKAMPHYGPHGKMTDEIKASIIKALASNFNCLSVAHAHGISGETFRRHYKEDPVFAQGVADAKELYCTVLRKEVHRRGVEGWDEPVFYKGEHCGDVRRYDSALLTLQLRRLDPSYRETSKIDVKAEHTGTIVGAGMEDLGTEARAAMRAVLEAEVARRKKAQEEHDASEPEAEPTA